VSDIVPIVVAVVAAVSAIVGSWLTTRAARKQSEASAAETFTDTALSLIAPLRTQLAELQALVAKQGLEIEFLKKENELLHRWAQLLYTQVLEAGGEPYSFEWVRDREWE
jgi:hypothetical protein